MVERRVRQMIEINKMNCDLCKNEIDETKEWDIIDGLQLCQGCKEKIEAVEAISPVFRILLCEKIQENNELMR